MKSFSEQHYEQLGFITTGNYFSNQNKKSLLKEQCTMELLSLSVYHISSKSTNSERTQTQKQQTPREDFMWPEVSLHIHYTL
jgi:hypothetical protein